MKMKLLLIIGWILAVLGVPFSFIPHLGLSLFVAGSMCICFYVMDKEEQENNGEET